MNTEIIKKTICSHFNLKWKEIISKSKRQHYTNVRIIFCKIVFDNSRLSKTEIGREINRSHCLVLYFLRKFDDLYQTDRIFRENYDKLLLTINN